jgi:hypothetical protein
MDGVISGSVQNSGLLQSPLYFAWKLGAARFETAANIRDEAIRARSTE